MSCRCFPLFPDLLFCLFHDRLLSSSLFVSLLICDFFLSALGHISLPFLRNVIQYYTMCKEPGYEYTQQSQVFYGSRLFGGCCMMLLRFMIQVFPF